MSAQELLALVDAKPLDIDALAAALDAADYPTKLTFLGRLRPGQQRRLFDAAEGRRAGLEHLVPPGHAHMDEVIHQGQNTLPAFRSFQKRFCTPSEGDGTQIWGYNHQTMAPITGPGYFVAYEEGNELVIDYKQLPPGKPESWPSIKSNKAGLSRFVYGDLVDRMRYVAQGVTVGRAYKKKPMSAWFTLLQQPVDAP